MKINLTKRQVIKALRTEPLMAGEFFHKYSNYTYDDDGNAIEIKYNNNNNCAVCAVGCLLNSSKLGEDVMAGKNKLSLGKLDQIARNLTEDVVFKDEDGDVMSLSALTVTGVVNMAREKAKDGQYLSALSSLFEALSVRDGYTTSKDLANYRLVNILVNFVKAEFPSKLVLDTKKKY